MSKMNISVIDYAFHIHTSRCGHASLDSVEEFVYRAKGMIRELSAINFEIAQMTVAADDQEALPDWFMMEVIRDLPRLVH